MPSADFNEPSTRSRSLNWLIARALFYPTLGWNLLCSRLNPRRHWWNHVDANLIVGALPLASHVPGLKTAGVTGVLNMCEEYAGPLNAYAAAGIEQLRLPTIDFTPPELADIRRGVEFIDAHAQRGGRVYVHCKAGRARSATVALCWLVKARGLSLEAAQAKLLEARPQIYKWVYQRKVVKEYCGTAQRT